MACLSVHLPVRQSPGSVSQSASPSSSTSVFRFFSLPVHLPGRQSLGFSVCQSICQDVSISVSQSASPSARTSVFRFLSLLVHLPGRQSLGFSVCRSICQDVSLSVSQSASLSVYSVLQLSVFNFISLSVCQFLEIYLDPLLSFKFYIGKTANKLSTALCFLRKNLSIILCSTLFKSMAYTFGPVQLRLYLKGHGNEAGFSGVFVEIGSSWVPYTTFRAVLILASNSQRYSYSKNDSPLSPIRGVANPSYWWVGESTTPRITDTRSRRLPASPIRRVGYWIFFKENSLYRWYGESESRRLRVSPIRRVDDSAYCWVG